VKRIAALLKPGGWFLVDECDIGGAATGNPLIKASMDILIADARAHGADIRIARTLGHQLTTSGVFSEVNSKLIKLTGNPATPLGKQHQLVIRHEFLTNSKTKAEPSHRLLNETLHSSAIVALRGWRILGDSDGSKTDTFLRGIMEMTIDKSPNWNWDTGVGFAWARKL
jgi:hypothetical protein